MRGAALALGAMLLATCAAPPAAPPPAPVTSGLVVFAPAFDDYRIHTRRADGAPCTPAPGALHYVESLEYPGSPPVAFGLDDGGCVHEIRTVAGTSRYEHVVALVTRRLGGADGADRATCASTGSPIECRYWLRPEGRFEVVHGGVGQAPAFVLRSGDAPFAYPWLCPGEIVR